MAFVILFVLGIFPRIILYTKLYLASSSNPSAVISTSIPSLTGYEPKSRFRCFRPGAGRQVLKLHSSVFVFSLRHVVLCFTTLRTHHQLRRSINMSKFQAALLNVSSCVPTVGYLRVVDPGGLGPVALSVRDKENCVTRSCTCRLTTNIVTFFCSCTFIV